MRRIRIAIIRAHTLTHHPPLFCSTSWLMYVWTWRIRKHLSPLKCSSIREFWKLWNYKITNEEIFDRIRDKSKDNFVGELWRGDILKLFHKVLLNTKCRWGILWRGKLNEIISFSDEFRLKGTFGGWCRKEKGKTQIIKDFNGYGTFK